MSLTLAEGPSSARIPRNLPDELKPLTSLRFFAAAMIAILHLQERFNVPWAEISDKSLRQGIAFFFVLSGFILTHVYIDQKGLTLRKFVTLRLARIYPVHVAAMVLLVAVMPWSQALYSGPGPDVNGQALLAKLLLVDSIIPTQPFQYAWNGVSWSISTELFFYLAFPFLLIDLRAEWPKRLLLAAMLTIIAYAGAQAIGVQFYPTRANTPSIFQIAYCDPLARGFEFVIGMAAYIGYERIILPLKRPAAFWSLLEVAMLALLAVWIFHWNGELQETLPRLPMLWMMVSGSCVFLAIFIAVIAPGRGLLGRALSARWMVWLGQISFSFYMLHYIVLHAFDYYWGRQAPIGIAVCVALAVAAASYRFIETPARRAILSRTAPRTGARLQSSAAQGA
jgi:peptidoglycan/LPS O-acetylase OafA/YrhL